MASNRVTRADISKALRSNGIFAIEDAGVVVLEPDGTFSVLKKIERARCSALCDVPGFNDLVSKGNEAA
jgi:uncharacterized membrane protein YcaP (DUF421 family)